MTRRTLSRPAPVAGCRACELALPVIVAGGFLAALGMAGYAVPAIAAGVVGALVLTPYLRVYPRRRRLAAEQLAAEREAQLHRTVLTLRRVLPAEDVVRVLAGADVVTADLDEFLAGVLGEGDRP